jgi:PleD family two-component response regulator
MTVSVGVAGAVGVPIDPNALLARADAACYRAKKAGRNRVEADAATQVE